MGVPTSAGKLPLSSRVAGRAFIVPADLSGPSGGLAYNRQVLRAWNQQRFPVVEEQLGGAWPHPDEPARQALTQLLSRYQSVLVDGIIASAAPEEMARARAAGVEVAVLMHLPLPAETGLSPAQRKSAEASERQALQRADLVVATSHWARRDLITRYGELTTAVAAPGCDPAALAPGSSPPRLLFLGAISPRKNPLLLLRALDPLAHLQWQLTIAGPDGPDQDYVDAVCAAVQAHPGRADLPGAVTGAALDRLWAGADLLVLPSRAETYGMVVSEAVAHGVPALVGAGTGAEEALGAAQLPVGSGDTSSLPGRAVDPTDDQAWTHVLRQWLEDADLRTRWRTTAEVHRDRLPTWKDTAQRLRTALRW